MLTGLLVHWRFVWLIVASLLAGIVNGMAGGGSFISFPAMLGLGILPIEANATNTVALWPGQLTSLFAVHKDLRKELLPVVLSSSILGGLLGGWVLIHTRQITFLRLIPWLLLIGAVLFGLSGRISTWLRNRSETAVLKPKHEHRVHRAGPFVALLPVCFYVGYFGAGSGLLIMTVLALFGMEQMHQLNALKILSAGTSNLFAIFLFMASGRILWRFCIISMVAAAIGGYFGARYARRVSPAVLRMLIVLIGVTLAAYFFWRQR